MVLLRELSLVAFLALTHSANAFYSKGGAVLNIDEKSFKKEILSSEHVSVSITKPNETWILLRTGTNSHLTVVRLLSKRFLPYVTRVLFLRLSKPRLR